MPAYGHKTKKAALPGGLKNFAPLFVGQKHTSSAAEQRWKGLKPFQRSNRNPLPCGYGLESYYGARYHQQHGYVVILCRVEMGWKNTTLNYQFTDRSRNPLPCGDGLEVCGCQSVRRLYQRVVILCRVEMGWKCLQSTTIRQVFAVVILCRVEMGWKNLRNLRMTGSIVVILCRVEMGWKTFYQNRPTLVNLS